MVSVGRCKFRLCENIVSLLIQSAIGGNASSFSVLCLGDRVFQFSVASKEVGLFIYKLRFYECGQFKILFHLWGDGGPRSNREVQQWDLEEEAEWTLVTNKKGKKHLSYADAVKWTDRSSMSTNLQKNAQANRNFRLTGANAIPIHLKLPKRVPVF